MESWKLGPGKNPSVCSLYAKKLFDELMYLSRKCCYQGLEGYSRDPGLERHSGSGIRQNLRRGIAAEWRIQTFRWGGGVSNEIFSALQASVWTKCKGAPLLDPPVIGKESGFQEKDERSSGYGLS